MSILCPHTRCIPILDFGCLLSYLFEINCFGDFTFPSTCVFVIFQAIISVLMMRACLVTSVTFPSWRCHLGALLIGSLLDLDHFISANSFSLYDASHLGIHRPFGHALLFIIAASCIASVFFQNGRRFGLVMFACLLSHQLRDSIRRGLWLYPFPSTNPVPYFVYLICLVMIPVMVQFIQHRNQCLFFNLVSRNCSSSRLKSCLLPISAPNIKQDRTSMTSMYV